MYVHAIQVYQKLLEEETLEEVREGFTESICHNLGCAYSYLIPDGKSTSNASAGHMRAAAARKHWRLIFWQSGVTKNTRRISEHGKAAWRQKKEVPQK